MRRLIILIILISCKGISKDNGLTTQNSSTSISTAKTDSLKIKPCEVTSKPGIFETAFFEHTQVNVDSVVLDFYSVDAGKINIESGNIIACDPILLQDAKPFTQKFPVGNFPVQLAIAKSGNNESVAFSRIFFSEKPVAKWEFALLDGQEKVPIDGETFYGYSVDAGIGLFIDEKSSAEFNRLSKADESLWQKVFTQEIVQYHHRWYNMLYNFGTHNLASFSTGDGDGHYGTYVGYDDSGKPCRLLTDFGLVEWWK